MHQSVEMDPITYKQLKEQFVSDLSGTTMSEIAALSAIFPAFLLLRKWSLILFRDGSEGSSQTWIDCLQDLSLDFIIVVIPILTVITILADRVYLIMGVIFCTISIIFWILRSWSQTSNIPYYKKKELMSSRLQFVSSYRFVVMLLTCLSILAVDFNIFPRRYAKAETYGSGLMDIGVGSFVVVNALVSRQARGILQGKERASIFRSICPLLFMGFARLCLTRGVDYQVHVGEYGVHWNFFFTLSAVALLTNLVQIPPYLCGMLGAFILFVYQVLLLCGLNEYINSTKRGVNLFSQNKEGIFSLFGYWGLYLVSVQLGYYIFKPKENPVRENGRLSFGYVLKIWNLTALFWILALLSNSFVERISRRMCNLTYVMFTLAINLEGLGVLALSELIPGGGVPQLILEDIFTENMLATFLLANVLTGLVNLNVDTLFASTSMAYGILIAYLLVLVAGMGLLRTMGIKIKF